MEVSLRNDKRIGRVIFFVEGDEDEPLLLKAVFADLLGYSYVLLDRRDQQITKYISEKDEFSKVYVIPMPTSAIKNIPADDDFRDYVYSLLKEHGLQYDESRIYYLFDRDPQSNKAPTVKEKISTLRNPLDNGEEMAGALVLSYPCLQAYYVECYDYSKCFQSSKAAKSFVGSKNIRSLTPNSLRVACNRMLTTIKEITGESFQMNWLDDYGEINAKVFEAEETHYLNHYKEYRTLSLLSIALLDLGVLEFK